MRKPVFLFLMAILATSLALAALPAGFEQSVDDPSIFLTVLERREPTAQKVIYTLYWPAPVETIVAWKRAGYDVRMLLPNDTPPQLLALLQEHGVRYRLFLDSSEPAGRPGIAAAAARTLLIYLPPDSWKIISNASYAGLYANLAYLWDQLAQRPTQNAPAGGR